MTAVFAGDPSTWAFDALSVQDYVAIAVDGGLPSVLLGAAAARADGSGEGPASGSVEMSYDAVLSDVLGRSDDVPGGCANAVYRRVARGGAVIDSFSAHMVPSER